MSALTDNSGVPVGQSLKGMPSSSDDHDSFEEEFDDIPLDKMGKLTLINITNPLPSLFVA